MVTDTIREENGEFCVAVVPATRTAGILTINTYSPAEGVTLAIGYRRRGEKKWRWLSN